MKKMLIKIVGCVSFPKRYWSKEEIRAWKKKYLRLVMEEVILIIEEYNHGRVINMRDERIRKWILFLCLNKQKKRWN